MPTQPTEPDMTSNQPRRPHLSLAEQHERSADVPPWAALTTQLRLIVGVAAVVFPAVYFISDLIEVAQGSFSTFRLIMTYIGEAGFPIFVIGIYATQFQRLGRLGLFGAVAYAYSYLFFTSTVMYALIAKIPNWTALTKAFGPWMAVHGAIMVAGGMAFGFSIVRATVMPRWTGVCLIVGVVLVAAAAGLPNAERTVAASLPDIAFVGMGIALTRSALKSRQVWRSRHIAVTGQP
jgi:hypothetical protein